MSDRLDNLINTFFACVDIDKFYSQNQKEKLADWLRENGVIVPPCKVGDIVYYPWVYDGQCGVAFTKVESIKIYVNGLPIIVVEDWGSDMPMPISFTNDDFGKTVFITEEAAKRALKEGVVFDRK